jgi:NAD(P)-dependent dehydrogenase (short-subunit alcohol dehydrogenase family)
MKDLLGHRALVTGGAIRLGRSISVELADAGADVIVHCHSHPDAAEEVAAAVRARGARAVVVRGDLADGKQVRRVFADADRLLGPPDILVNNAGIFEQKPFESIEEASLRRMLDVNLVGPFLCAQEAARRMRAAGQGDIVNVVDIGGATLAWKGYAHYCSAKAGLAMLTRVLAVELAPEIRVNGVAPGAILFPETEDEETRRRALSRVPQGRPGDAEDVARTVRFLVSGPRYITGQIVAVDGGRTAAG